MKDPRGQGRGGPVCRAVPECLGPGGEDERAVLIMGVGGGSRHRKKQRAGDLLHDTGCD